MSMEKHVIGRYKDNELYYLNSNKTDTGFVLGYDESKESYFYYQMAVIELYLENKDNRHIRLGYAGFTPSGNDYIVSQDPDSYGVVLLDNLGTEKPEKSKHISFDFDEFFNENSYGDKLTRQLVEVMEKFDEDDVKQADKAIYTYGRFDDLENYKVDINDYVKKGKAYINK